MIIYQILVILAIILIIIRSIISAIRDQKLIELSAQRLARKRQTKQPKKKIFEFIEDETDPYLMASSEEEESESLYW